LSLLGLSGSILQQSCRSFIALQYQPLLRDLAQQN